MKYDGTRHNIGFAVTETFRRKKIEGSKAVEWNHDKGLNALLAVLGQAHLVQPQTYVNLSGQTVSAIARKLNISLQDILVVCDDVNLAFGKLRLRASGSGGGHHGLESIIGALGSQEFPRLRMGVGGAQLPRDLTGFVLEKFSAEEAQKIPGILEKAVSICNTWVKEGFEPALNCLSRFMSSPQSFGGDQS